MNIGNKHFKIIEGLGGSPSFLHTYQSVSPSYFYYIRHSSFDTVLQQQKQRWRKMGVCQRNQFTPRMIGQNTNQEYLKAVAVGKLKGNKSALKKVSVGGITL